jgi:hypothetical protein
MRFNPMSFNLALRQLGLVVSSLAVTSVSAAAEHETLFDHDPWQDSSVGPVAWVCAMAPGAPSSGTRPILECDPVVDEQDPGPCAPITPTVKRGDCLSRTRSIDAAAPDGPGGDVSPVASDENQDLWICAPIIPTVRLFDLLEPEPEWLCVRGTSTSARLGSPWAWGSSTQAEAVDIEEPTEVCAPITPTVRSPDAGLGALAPSLDDVPIEVCAPITPTVKGRLDLDGAFTARPPGPEDTDRAPIIPTVRLTADVALDEFGYPTW